MDILISNLLSESILDFEKWPNGKYANTHIFCLATSQSPKLIPKAHLKWECPYFYSNFFYKEFIPMFEKV